MRRSVDHEGRRHTLKWIAGGTAVAVVLGPDALRDAAKKGIDGVVEGLNPFTPQEQERILGIVPEKLTTLNDVGLARRPYLVTSQLDKGWKWVPGWLAGEEATLTTRWRADWRIQDFSGLTEPGKVVLVPEKRLVVLTLPRSKPTDIVIDPTYKPKIKRRPGAANANLGLGTLIEEHDFNAMNLDAMQRQVDGDGEAGEFADEVGLASFAAFCTGLLQSAGCTNARFQVAYEGDATIADNNIQYGKGIVGVTPDGPPVPLQLYVPPAPERITPSTTLFVPNSARNQSGAQTYSP